MDMSCHWFMPKFSPFQEALFGQCWPAGWCFCPSQGKQCRPRGYCRGVAQTPSALRDGYKGKRIQIAQFVQFPVLAAHQTACTNRHSHKCNLSYFQHIVTHFAQQYSVDFAGRKYSSLLCKLQWHSACC